MSEMIPEIINLKMESIWNVFLFEAANIIMEIIRPIKRMKNPTVYILKAF